MRLTPFIIYSPTLLEAHTSPVAAPPLVGLQPSLRSEKEEVILSPGPRRLGLKQRPQRKTHKMLLWQILFCMFLKK